MAASASCPRKIWSRAPTGCCCRATPMSAWATSASGRTPSGWRASSAASIDGRPLMADWRFGSPGEEHFEPLLDLRIAVMREHLERVNRYKPERARRIFREHFDEPGLRLILTGGDVAGCVGFRIGAE